MPHDEDKPPYITAIDLVEQMYRESFRMAEHLIQERIQQVRWSNDDARDRYVALTPMIALDIKNTLSNIQGIEQAQPRQVEDAHRSLGDIVREVKRRNDLRDKETE